jgi:hypothetical protein
MTQTTKKRSANKRRSADTTALEAFLDTLTKVTRPTVHVNGLGHPTALVTVDLGAPIGGVRLNSEDMQELSTLLRECAASLYRKDITIRVSSDVHNGIYWASIG